MRIRYVLRRADGCFFHQPDDLDIREWRPEASSAHKWVDADAAASAAYIWQNLKGEDVRVIALTLGPNHYMEYSV